MSRSKQALFHGIMAVMTLLVIEGMAQAAYYIAYREFNGGGPSRPQPAVGDAAGAVGWRTGASRWVVHPYYGFTRTEAGHPINRAAPPRREDGVVLIALLGGSVSRDVANAFRSALEGWFQDNGIPLRPVVQEQAASAMKQPQQAMIIANTLSLGGEYDIIVNLDGFNELILSHNNYFGDGLSPFYPFGWHRHQSGLTDAQKLLVSRIYALRQREGRLDGVAGARPWRWSALYGIVNRYLRERSAAEILDLNHELADTLSGEYSLQHYGPVPANAPDGYELSRSAARVWYRGSVLLHELSRGAGAEYYHFLQPNQYVPDSKPLTDRELARAYDSENAAVGIYRDGYPLLRRLGDELRQQGINYYDLTQIFADNRETLYRDDCCHLNKRGHELLAASMVQRLAPALRERAALAASRVGGGGGITADTALDAAAQEISPVHAANALYFDVLVMDDGILRYTRDDCRPADAAAPFFVRIAPVDAGDLLPGGADPGYNSYDFSFDRDGGTIDAAGRCVVKYALPDYDIATVLTGQYGETGDMLWRARLTLDWGFAVERTAAGTLRYSRENCLPAHIAADFFLHIVPADARDLRPAAVEYGFDNYDFLGFRPNDGLIDAAGRCVVERTLPEYDIASIVTGQYTPNSGRLWETRIDFMPP